MTTRLQGTLKRELEVKGDPYTLTITSEGLSLTPKGKRKGYALAWDAFVTGDAAFAAALNASLLASRAIKPSLKKDTQDTRASKKAKRR